MKVLSVSAIALLLSAHAMAAPSSPIKTCSTDISTLDGSSRIPTLIEIFAEADTFRAKITETVDGVTDSSEEAADVFEQEIRAGLASLTTDEDIDKAELNMGEMLIVHAITVASDPSLNQLYGAGFDLKPVRSVKAYFIGKPGAFGWSAIVEARDGSGKPLGSFLGGLLVSPCK